MRAPAARYPVDRYLVESSKKIEMVNIIDDDIWNTEPALRPDDEVILRKLHEMLQSTADDLKLLSGELTKFREPGLQAQMTPTPLDEEFNEKVHIEEVVNAKFHGYKIIDKTAQIEKKIRTKQTKNIADEIKPTNIQQKISNHALETNGVQFLRKPVNRNLEITRPKVIQINGYANSTKTETLNNGKVVTAPSVAYNEFCYKYTEPKNKTPRKVLEVQAMPSINIRGELKQQQVLHLDIIPVTNETENTTDIVKKNVAVLAVEHDNSPRVSRPVLLEKIPVQYFEQSKPSVRKVSKLSTGESSGSTNNNSFDPQVQIKAQKRVVSNIRSPKIRSDRKNEPEKRSHLHIDKWKRKLNAVYGMTSGNNKKSNCKPKIKVLPKKDVVENTFKNPNSLRNAEYIPYSKLTIGGVRASDIEREISDISNKNEVPLSPILDRILSSSRENSFSKSSQRKHRTKDSKIFTTSDENLLQEVIDIERTVSETLSREHKKTNVEAKVKMQDVQKTSGEDESYADDFEDEKSDLSKKSENIKLNDTLSENSNNSRSGDIDEENDNIAITRLSPSGIHNRTFTRTPNLSFKNSVDIYEFVHSVDTQDSATQSNATQKLSRKETQTSPRNSIKIQHNDLWPATDPIIEVEKMFKIEKEFIKKLIIEEYGDVLEKNVSKPSTSQDNNNKNVSASQKNTQTSPAHTKHVMTSPTNTKTRTTSPFASLAVDNQTSPLIFVTNDDEIKFEVGEEDLGISINLSSPRFCLRLPQTSREVLHNIEGTPQKPDTKKTKSHIKSLGSSTSSADADSSELSSLGEVRHNLRRKARRYKIFSSSESTCSSSTIYSADLLPGILPLRSEGEMSLSNKKSNNKSEGEASGQI